MFVFACRDCSFLLSVIGDFLLMELIQAEDIANTETVTQKSRTKRNTYVQTWRRCKRYERRQAAFVQEYVETKYRAINDEAMEFYKSLNVSYPKKYDLRKTYEFKKWKKTILGQPKKKSSGPVASQDNSGPVASQDNSGPVASQDNSGPVASQDNSGSVASQDNSVTVEVLPPLLTDQNINQILEDLRNDPELNTIMNEIEIEMEKDDVFW